MEISPEERLILLNKKDEIRKLTENILELAPDLENNSVDLKKKITGILSLISTISSYSKKKIDMLPLIQVTQLIFESNRSESYPKTTNLILEIFCNIVNSITFDFTKKQFSFNIDKIDLSLFKKG